MRKNRSQWSGRGLAVAGTAAALTLMSACSGSGADDSDVEVQLLAFNDLHGRLAADDSMLLANEDGEEVPAGGTEYLATHLAEARDGQPNSATVAAGDLIGATPFMSAAFNDEPTLEAVEAMGLDVSSVGNHEFDGGVDELQRLIDGGCPEDGCPEGTDEWEGTSFEYLGANVVDKKTEEPVLNPTWVKDFGDGVEVGFIGMTLEGTGDIVSKEGVKDVDFLDEVETANKHAEKLMDDGVNAIVVLLHEGGFPVEEDADYDCDTVGGTAGVSGPIVDIAEGLDSAIDVVVTGHTHQNYVCNIPDPEGTDRLVTSAESYGRVMTDIRADYDTESNDFARASVEGSNLVVDREVSADSDQTEIIERYDELADGIGSEVVGYIDEDIVRVQTRDAESALGNLIADMQLERTASDDTGGADIAVMNPGGIRDDLLVGDDGEVTYADAFSVQPFSNYLVTMDLTGDQLVELLQQQWTDRDDEPLILQWSEGFSYTIDDSQTGADRLVEDSLELNGEAIEADQTYRVTANSFLADGGDSFHTFADGENRLTGELDLDAMLNWFADNSSADEPVTAPEINRITVE
ncbi:bifunctional metallophosphatase/5'-nucleotidase [Haloglycomyces albus]|uniref:bifunctional metallophosphatase/5'-nucleotidase n=1 Tax=Haloglycomyces albus TaxID=526067 RepID=UPI0004A228BC|nr:bifunctional metallophosphatase/5'-nucleotidase [Haloglycomyces albus]